jgi:hypothetical protein
MFRGRKTLTQEEVREFAKAMTEVDFNDPTQRRALAETIVKDLREEIIQDNIIELLGVETETFLPGQSVQFVTRKGLKAYVHEPGSAAPRSTITNKIQTLTTELVSVHPEMEIAQLQSGRYGSVQEIKDFALEALLARKYGIVWNTLIASVPTTQTAPQYQALALGATTAIKKAALDSGIDYVADQPGSYPVAIVGRRSALAWVADYPGYNATNLTGPSDRKKVEIDYSLYPGTYRGLPVIMLNQYNDGWGTKVISESGWMVVGSNTLKMGIDRQLDFMESVDVDTLMWHIHMFESYGFGVFNATRNSRVYQA